MKNRKNDIQTYHTNIGASITSKLFKNNVINKNGITLIALAITIILMLILAGVVLNLTLGENGIIKMTEVAKEETDKAQIQEEIQLKLTEIIADKLAQNIQITNNLIKEELENKLLGIEVTEELTGTYKGYEYWIDENNNVHIGEKANNPITVKLIPSYIGTSSCTVEVEASSKEGNIVGYQYKIGNTQTEQLPR